MSQPHSRDALPRVPLMAAGGLVLATLLAVSLVQATGQGATRVADAPALSVRQFTFEDRSDGGIDVRRADTGQVVHSVAPETNGFLRGTMRGLARERKRQGLGPELPFELIGRADGRLTLADPGTGRRVDLDSFGPDNSAVFASLMSAR
jgi:putative photosynthetic complex assembly protein